MKLTKRNILWLVPIIIIIIFWYFYGPKEEITDNEYIDYVKQSTYKSQSKTYEEAFANYCKEGKWVYFQTSKNQNVVEFKGTCPNEKKNADVNLQFIVDEDKKNYTIGAMLLDGKQLSEEEKDKFIQLFFDF